MGVPCAWAWLHEGSQASGTEEAGRPPARASRERECGCSLSLRLLQSFLPGPWGPIPHPHSMPHALSFSGRCAHLPDTHTLSASSPCLCLDTGVPWVDIQAAGRFLPSQGDVKWGQESQMLEHAPVPAPGFQVLHNPPIPAPPAMPASRTHGAEGLDPAKVGTWGCIPGLDSATPTCNGGAAGLAPACGQSPAPGKSSQVQRASFLHVLRPPPPRGQQCGDGAAAATTQRGAGGVGSVVIGFGGLRCGPQESSGFGS